jgi:16S rRNA processing protein RimM
MSTTEPVKVGKIIDAHSLKGEVYFLSFAKDISWLEKGAELTLESFKVGGQKNFTITTFRPFKDGALIKFEGVDNRNQSEELKGAIVYVPDENFVSEPGDTIYLREVLNFEVVDEDGKSLGKVKEFNSNSIQDLLVIYTGTFSYEVPFVDDFIVEIQFEKSTIVMNFPLDLMDINRVV